ncbi:hypothetical protein ACS7SF_10605 [Ralstonia sp. 25C]|uniref:hypothetical protein n=1 Tax=Ralstonia sp. 25C TaxID=3447363 RepID=UPI003F752AFB
MNKLTGIRVATSILEKHAYVCDLIYAEGPLLCLFRDARRNWLYFWCDTDGVEKQRWLVFPVARAALVAYLTGESTLRDVVLTSEERYAVDVSYRNTYDGNGEFTGRAQSRVVKKLPNLDELADCLPSEESIFDAELAPDISLTKEINPTTFDVPIDGKWFFSDLDSFSKVYAQLYAFFYCTKPRFVRNIGERMRRYLSAPWTGGYSRVNLFEALKQNIPSLHDLEIKKISYASPGEIRIEALESVGVNIANAVSGYIKNQDALVESERMINQLLNSNMLRKADLSSSSDDKLPLSRDNISFLKSSGSSIASTLGIEEEVALLNEYSPNVVVSTKVLMALLTRIQRVAAFEKAGMLDLYREQGKSKE